MRVAAFVDGFNLYHSIDDLGKNYLKWVNLRRLCEVFAPRPQFDLVNVFYFSAYATWLPDAYKRHREFVRALQAVRVTPVMGNFKEKDRHCRRCGASWKAHEEKETDVNIAIHLLREAHRDSFDRALVLTADSDLSPALRLFRQEFPGKGLMLITPAGRFSRNLTNAVGGKKHCGRIREFHIERSLLPRELADSSGSVVAVRPVEYDPPSGIRPAPTT